MLLTICYFIITVIGIVYSYYFYQAFEINILKFADLSDFLLASILEPRSIVIFILLVVFSILMFLFDFWIRKRFKGYANFMEKKFMSKYSDPIAFSIVVIVFTLHFVNFLAISNANKIKKGNFDGFEIRLSDPGENAAEQTLAVLGSSSRYTYLYNPKKNESLIIPVENVSFMLKKMKTQIDKNAAKIKVEPSH